MEDGHADLGVFLEAISIVVFSLECVDVDSNQQADGLYVSLRFHHRCRCLVKDELEFLPYL